MGGFFGIVAYSLYNYRKKSAGTATSLYVIHTRMAAQGLVITLLTGTVCYHMFKKIINKDKINAKEVPKSLSKNQ